MQQSHTGTQPNSTTQCLGVSESVPHLCALLQASSQIASLLQAGLPTADLTKLSYHLVGFSKGAQLYVSTQMLSSLALVRNSCPPGHHRCFCQFVVGDQYGLGLFAHVDIMLNCSAKLHSRASFEFHVAHNTSAATAHTLGLLLQEELC